MKNIKQVAIVTGASAGIGKATARILNNNGWVVYAAARRVEAMLDLAKEGIRPIKLDITDYDQCNSVVATILGAEGRIDALINNAGYGSYGALELVTDEEARRQFDVNIFGLMHLTRQVLPTMRKQLAGKIINISSIGGRITAPLGGWYHATKFALEGLSDALRNEVKPFGIDVVVIQPGNVTSEWAGIAADNLLKASNDGPYRNLERAMAQSFKTGVNETRGILAAAPPESIGNLVLKILKTRKPKTRYAAPFHAKLFLLFRWIMSDDRFDRMMEKQIAKLANAGT